MSKDIITTYHTLIAEVLPLSDGGATALVNFKIIDFFKELVGWGYENKPYAYASSAFYGRLAKIEVDDINNRIDILFRHTDLDDDQYLVSDVHTQLDRQIPRNVTEGTLNQSHIVIKIDPSKPTIANFGMEYYTGITPLVFMNTLNYLIRTARSDKVLSTYFFGNHPTDTYKVTRDGYVAGQPKPLGFRLKFSYQNDFFYDLLDAFNNDRVKDISFVEKPTISTNFDRAGKFKQNNIETHLHIATRLVNPNSTTLGQMKDDVVNVFKNLITEKPHLKDSSFKIKFEDVNGQERHATYKSQDEEFSLVQKKRLSSSLRQPRTSAPTINKGLCDRIFANIT